MGFSKNPGNWDQFHQKVLFIKRGISKNGELLKVLTPLGHKVAIIYDERLGTMAENLKTHLHPLFSICQLFPFQGGELHKTRETKIQIEDSMLNQGFGRDTILISLGGGITLDLGGFIAATYMRGIPSIYFPTSLLAMVDASIGGKTGVNTQQGKNLIGAFYPPKALFLDPDFLENLPVFELKNGLVEMFKHALISDAQFFRELLELTPAILNKTFTQWEDILIKNSRIKWEITQKDPQETGLRTLLNLGHTVGHALEQSSGFLISHGQGVALGLLAEGWIGEKLKITTPECFSHILNLFKLLSLFDKKPNFNKNLFLNALSMDKKNRKARIRMIFLKNPGDPYIESSNGTVPVEEEMVSESFDWVMDFLEKGGENFINSPLNKKKGALVEPNQIT